MCLRGVRLGQDRPLHPRDPYPGGGRGVLFEEQPPAVLFSWHMADVIVPKLRERGYRGKIIVPLPEVRYL